MKWRIYYKEYTPDGSLEGIGVDIFTGSREDMNAYVETLARNGAGEDIEVYEAPCRYAAQDEQ